MPSRQFEFPDDFVFDVIIIGAGVTGMAQAYTLSTRTNVRNIAVLEKNLSVAEVNSNPWNNAQTSHDGSTETNYTHKHALEVKPSATVLRTYVRKRNAPGLYKVTDRMALAIGQKEVIRLRARFEQIKADYPDLRMVERDELGKIEPFVMKGRSKRQPVCAMVSSEGFAINYKILSECFLEDATAVNPDLKTFFGVQVRSIRRNGKIFTLETTSGTIRAKFVEFAAGSYSLSFAHSLGYGLNLGIMSYKGDFWSAPKLVNGKVYRMQDPNRPFAEIHCDPDVMALNHDLCRFGPTTLPEPFMEAYRYGTFWDFVKSNPVVSLKGIFVLLWILFKNKQLLYVMKNWLFLVPIIGKLMFLREARKIIPSLSYWDIVKRRRAGGLRPQIVNMDTWKLEMGDKTISEPGCIFNTTPSPGASVCLGNAIRDAEKIVNDLGSDYWFDREGMEIDLGLKKAS